MRRGRAINQLRWGPRIPAVALLLGVCLAVSAFLGPGVAAYGPVMTLTTASNCVRQGEAQTVTVGGGQVGNILVTYPDGTTTNPGTQTGIVAGSTGFIDTWTVSADAPVGEATIQATAVGLEGVVEGIARFTIGAAGQACHSNDFTYFTGAHVSRPGAPTYVKKTCDSGLTGDAVFSMTVAVPGVAMQFVPPNQPTVITLPANWDLRARCNGAPVLLPPFEWGNVVTLHEVAAPAGAMPASDTSLTMDFADLHGKTVTNGIHNAKAATVATPTPRPTTRRLALTGGGPQVGTGVSWTAVVIGLLLVSSAVLRLGKERRRRKRSEPPD